MSDRLVLLVRHAAYDSDPERLSDLGRQQAQCVAERIRELAGHRPPNRLVRSQLPRAVETAAVIGVALDMDIQEDTMLAECVPSVPANRNLTDPQRAFFARVSERSRSAGARQAAAARERYLSAPRKGDPGGVDVLVTHGNLIRWLVCSQLETGPGSWFRLVDYHCGISALVLRTGQPPTLLTFNDAGHLPPDLRGDEYPAEMRW